MWRNSGAWWGEQVDSHQSIRRGRNKKPPFESSAFHLFGEGLNKQHSVRMIAQSVSPRLPFVLLLAPVLNLLGIACIEQDVVTRLGTLVFSILLASLTCKG